VKVLLPQIDPQTQQLLLSQEAPELLLSQEAPELQEMPELTRIAGAAKELSDS
jgi:hypothetical protein